MRLIDADKCPCIICDDTRNAHCTYEHRSCTKFCNWLNSTAYDVEKVVEQLRENEEDISGLGDFGLDTECAIGIIRNGGKE